MAKGAIGGLKFDPKNLRKHGERSIAAIEESLDRFGANRAIVVDENDTILAGNGVAEAAAGLGLDKVQVVETDGHEVIAIRVKHLSEEEKKLYAVADNRTAEMSEWDTDALAEVIEGGLDVGSFWYQDELQTMVPLSVLDSPEDTAAREESEKLAEDRREYSRKFEHMLMCPHCYHQFFIGAVAEEMAQAERDAAE